MSRVLAVIAACLLLCVRAVAADTVQTNVTQLSTSGSYKVRLAAALALSKSKDARAVIAIADALENDTDPTIRRVSALALEKMIDARTAEDARELGLLALEAAASKDRDSKVKTTAKASLKALAGLKRKKADRSNKPPVFVNVDGTIDQSKKLGKDSTLAVNKIVRTSVERTGYATSWPGGLPTNAELSSSRSRGFIVASTVKKIDITKAGATTQIACTVSIRVAP